MINVLAHGLVQRSSLPIPEWLFGWAAAAVLCVSFVALAVLWPKPRLEDPGWRPLPGGLGAVVGSRAVEVVGGVIGVAALALVIVAGYVGPDTPLDNFSPTFVFIIFWVGLVFVSVLLGDVFRLLNPWRALGRVLFRGREPRPYPERLGRWPATAGLFVFTWIELASGWGEEPATLATAVLVYTVLTLGAIAVYGVEPWIRHGETFSVYFNLFARLSVFETRDRVVGVRPLLGGLPRLDPVPGTVALVAVMIGTVTFDGLSQGQLWKDLAVQLNDGFEALGFGLETTPKLVATVGLAIGVAIAGGFYALGIEGARSVGGGFDSERCGGRSCTAWCRSRWSTSPPTT